MAKTNPNAGQPKARKKQGKNKNGNNAQAKGTPNTKAPIIQTAPTVKSVPAIKSTPIVKNSAVKYSPAIKSLTAIRSTPTKSNANQNGISSFGTPIKSKVIDLSTEDSDCEIQKVVTLSGQERQRRQELAAKEAAESPMRNKRIKVELPPSKPRGHSALRRTPSKNSSPAKTKSVQTTPQTHTQHASIKDHGTPLKEVGDVVTGDTPASAFKKASEKRKAEVSIDMDDGAVHDALQVDEDTAAREKKRIKNERRAKRKAAKLLKEEQQNRAQVHGNVEADNDDGSGEVYSTAAETNDFHRVRDLQRNETTHDTQQRAEASSTKKHKSKKHKKHSEQTPDAPKSDGQFMQQLWGVLNGVGTNAEAAPYAPSDSDCILDEQASTPRKGICTVTRKVKIETAAANKPSPRFTRATTAPPPPTSLEASPSTNKSPLINASSSTPARIEDDLALVRVHFEAIQNHIAALRYLSRTRNMRQEQVQEGFRRLVRSIPRLPPPLFGKKKGSYEEVESSVQHEGLDEE